MRYRPSRRSTFVRPLPPFFTAFFTAAREVFVFRAVYPTS
jgi:hypothetical protein